MSDGGIGDERKRWEQRKVEPALKRGGERRERFTTSSGIEVEREYDPNDLNGFDYLRDLGFRGRVPVHPRRAADDVSRAAVDDAPVRGLRQRRGVQSPLSLPVRAWADRALGRVRSADPDGPRLPTICWLAAKSAASAFRSAR